MPGAREEGPREGDAGLFGPDSVTWRVHAETLMAVAGLRAMLLEALHPVAIAAFAEHATYRQDWGARLSRTAEYIAVTTFGSTTDAMLAASRVRASHARVHGTLPSGVSYDAEDPQLLAWVHCCLVASFLEVVTRGGLALTGVEQDAYVAEQVRAAMLVGLEPDEVPHDRAALQDYFRVIKPALECTAVARRAALDLVTAPSKAPASAPAAASASASARPTWAGVAGLAFAALPPWGRRLYALPELPGAACLADDATTLALRSLRTALRAEGGLPVPREDHYLSAARAHLRAAPDLPRGSHRDTPRC